jgi:hypothetical protein
LGPAGKVLATAVVLVVGPWGPVSVLTLMYGPFWVFLCVLVLKEVWRPRPIEPDAPPTPAERFRRRHPILGARLDVRLMAAVGLVLFGLSLMAMGTGARFLMVGLGVAAAFGFLLAWLSGY